MIYKIASSKILRYLTPFGLSQTPKRDRFHLIKADKCISFLFRYEHLKYRGKIMAEYKLLEGKRVLLVDDEPDVLDTLEDLLPMCETIKASKPWKICCRCVKP
jgi:hypothetical protein